MVELKPGLSHFELVSHCFKTTTPGKAEPDSNSPRLGFWSPCNVTV